jgi:hypothetical protein
VSQGAYTQPRETHTCNPLENLFMNEPSIRRTRYPELGYRQIGPRKSDPARWRFVDVSTDADVGAQYASKAELLADLERYASLFGCNGAAPFVLAPNVDGHGSPLAGFGPFENLRAEAEDLLRNRCDADRETATILAALRYWRREGLLSAGHEREIASGHGRHQSLSAEEIDALCERIICGDTTSRSADEPRRF